MSLQCVVLSSLTPTKSTHSCSAAAVVIIRIGLDTGCSIPVQFMIRFQTHAVLTNVITQIHKLLPPTGSAHSSTTAAVIIAIKFLNVLSFSLPTSKQVIHRQRNDICLKTS